MICDSYDDATMDESIIPDSAILLDPPGDISDAIRPNSSWATTTTKNREIILQVGDDLNRGGFLMLTENYNVKNFTVILINSTAEKTLKVLHLMNSYFIN